MAILAAIGVTLTTCAMQTKGKTLANNNCCVLVHNKFTNAWNQYNITTLKFKNVI